MPPLVHLVADYGAADLAFAEVVQRLAAVLPGAQVHCTPVAPFDTLAAGFLIAQLALTDGPPDRVVVHNVAPRGDDATPRADNEGERFCAGRTAAGVLIAGPDAGWSWSFCAPELDALRYLEVPAAGSQFRSRDVLPAAVAAVAAGDDAVLGAPVAAASIPPVPQDAVVYTDGYGNLKTTITEPPAPDGTRVLLQIGAESASAVVSDGTFDVREGELALAPGSSGWRTRDGAEVRFFEVFLRGGSAAHRFREPPSGTAVTLQAVEGPA